MPILSGGPATTTARPPGGNAMMKANFNEAFAKQVSPRALMPAEACSELGVASTATRPAKWFTRWLPTWPRWIVGRHPTPHG